MCCCNNTTVLCVLLCNDTHRYTLFGVLGGVLLISVSLNIYFVSKCLSGKRCCRRKRQGPRQMEDNPIYGNLHPLQTSVDLPPSSVRYTQMVTSNSQDCYANLSLKPPRCQSAQTQSSSDVMQLEAEAAAPEPQRADEGRADEGSADEACSPSDLYASVQTQRTKTLVPADTAEEYANHL